MMDSKHEEQCSTSTDNDNGNDVEDDRMIAILLTEDYGRRYGALGQHIPELSSVPHVPRINSYIPCSSDVNQEHDRLIQRLNIYGLSEVKVSGDGNCQFRALADQMYKSSEYHKHVRKEVVNQLKEWRSLYEGYVPMKYKEYCKKMARCGEWGDHVTLQAASDKFRAKICLLTSFKDKCFIEIVPQREPPQSEIWLSFWSEVHYNSVYELEDVPVVYKAKKKHWLF